MISIIGKYKSQDSYNKWDFTKKENKQKSHHNMIYICKRIKVVWRQYGRKKFSVMNGIFWYE